MPRKPPNPPAPARQSTDSARGTECGAACPYGTESPRGGPGSALPPHAIWRRQEEGKEGENRSRVSSHGTEVSAPASRAPPPRPAHAGTVSAAAGWPGPPAPRRPARRRRHLPALRLAVRGLQDRGAPLFRPVPVTQYPTSQWPRCPRLRSSAPGTGFQPGAQECGGQSGSGLGDAEGGGKS